ncbi:hypothetical protein SALBM311S_02116 [Streptomyces alboniger]
MQPRAWRVENAALQFLPRVHEDAGQLLRVLHASVSRVREAKPRATRSTVCYARRVQGMADQIAAVALPEQAQALRRSAALVLGHARELPPAFCHGTFGPATWEWQSQSQTLSFTGFGRSEIMAAVVDLARPALLWAMQPHLRDWFFKGYGRTLSEHELLILGPLSVLACGEDLLHAIHRRDKESISAAAAALSQAMDQNGITLDSDSTAPVDGQERWS